MSPTDTSSTAKEEVEVEIENDIEEWKFTLYNIPKDVSKLGQITLRHQQQVLSTETAGSKTKSNKKWQTDSAKSTYVVTEIDNDNDDDDVEVLLDNTTPERTSLIEDHNKNEQQRQQQTTIDNISWVLESSYWSIESSILLSITYCYAWQTIPEYTTMAAKYGSTLGKAIAKLTCCCNSDQVAYQPEYYTEHCTTNDIVKVQHYTRYPIPGVIGTCEVVKLYLRPLLLPNTNDDDNNNLNQTSTSSSSSGLKGPPRIPDHIRQAMEQLVQNSRSNRTAKAAENEKYNSNNMSNSQLFATESTANLLESSITDSNKESWNGPIVIFAFNHRTTTPTPPSNTKKYTTDPPLLWKVILPNPIKSSATNVDSMIAVHTISVFDGGFTQSSSTSSPQQRSTEHSVPTTSSIPGQADDNNTNHEDDPTHVYINGWQSWSYTGSIKRGMKQPTSALPNVISRAFNYGGSGPPSITTLLTKPNSLLNWKRRSPKFEKFYQSDFFTCITSDGSNYCKRHCTTNEDRRRQRRQRLLLQHQIREQEQPLDEMGGPALVLGWLSQRQQYGVVLADQNLTQFQMHASTHGQFLLEEDDIVVTDWAYAQLLSPHSYDEEPMADYLHAVAEVNHAKPLQNGNILTGWCSWYVFYENITAAILRENITSLSSMQKLHLSTNVTIIDDGYMTAWGDWESLKPQAFPLGSGLDAVSHDIQTSGGESHMRSGLWLAPYAADKHSRIVQEHPDWIIRNDKGIPANSSYCGKFFYGLDATNPAVRAHAYNAIHRAVHDWKFTVLKIDFLYAACLEGNGKYDLSMTRAQTMDIALRTIREAAGPDTFIIGCGCPIATGIGYVDAMRISADTGPTWYPSFPLPWWDNGTLPSLRSMVRNSLSRASFGHRWWHNDPDCIMLGKHTKLTTEEIASAATVVAMTCGMLLLSDDLPKVNATRLQIISKIFPLTGVTAVPLDLHSTKVEGGLPTLLRLWCTDKYTKHDSFHESNMLVDDEDNGGTNSPPKMPGRQGNSEATFFARQVSFTPGGIDTYDVFDRKRSCIHVTTGLGTWTVVSISNWSDQEVVATVPSLALAPPPKTGWDTDEDIHNPDDPLLPSSSLSPSPTNKSPKGTTAAASFGYHVFAFWSGKYTWIANVDTTSPSAATKVTKRLAPHETEVYHIKAVQPDLPQYIGSSIHFSCGYEVRKFYAATNFVLINLKTSYQREGYVYVYIPRQMFDTGTVRVLVNNERGQYSIVGNTPTVLNDTSSHLLGRIVQIYIRIHADRIKYPHDGEIKIEF